MENDTKNPNITGISQNPENLIDENKDEEFT